ncbi:class I SAM-dependent methyltransferase [Rugosimonospora acidiphila]|uniref:Class I SAM-dependent methyltransferase n=1 Tax=Rugosimonospora acidiphila TaxID=556531 RepID=A0ABP9ST23_9ACTN
MTDSNQRQARSFGTAAESYDRYRPTYAPEAIVWALGERPLRVADLGAGTGILSRVLRGLGHEVVAVEPDDQMRTRLAAVSPDITALAGAAERIPLPDRSVDAVVAGQAYHWFDVDRAHPEIARVLRPGGAFAVMRNEADPATPWTVRFAEIIDGPGGDARPAPDFGARFGPVEHAERRHEIRMTPDDLLAVATTRSPYLVADEPRRRELLDAVRRLIAEAGLGDGPFAMPYVTQVYRATVE